MAYIVESSVSGALSDFYGNGSRKLVILSNGWLIAVTYDSANVKATFYKSIDEGLTWTQLCFQSSNMTGGYALETNGTNVYCAFIGGGSSSVSFIKFDATTVSNSSVGGIVTIDAAVGNGNSISLYRDASGDLHCAYSCTVTALPNSNNIRYSKSSNLGVSWASVTQVTSLNTSGANIGRLSIITENNFPHVIANYDNGFGTQPMMHFTTRFTTKDIGITQDAAWGNNTVLNIASPTFTTQSNPCAVIDKNGRIYATWMGKDATDTSVYNIRSTYSADNGSTWQTHVKHSTGNTNTQSEPSITVDSNNYVHIVWYGINGADAKQSIQYVFYNGTSWSSVSKIDYSINYDLYTASALFDRAYGYAFKIPPILCRQSNFQNHGVFSGSYTPTSFKNVKTAPVDTPTTLSNVSFGNSGRKVIRLSNGWLIAYAVYGGSTATNYFWKSTDNGSTWTQLCFINNGGSAMARAGAIASYGTMVYVFTEAFVDGTISFWKFDATTQTNSNIYAVNRVQIETGVSAFSGAAICVNPSNGYITLFYSVESSAIASATFNIRSVRSSDGGSTFTRQDGTAGIDNLTTNTGGATQHSQSPSCCYMGNGYPIVIYENLQNTRIEGRYWNGTSWTLATVYDSGNTSRPQQAPEIIRESSSSIHPNRLWAVWNGIAPLYLSAHNILCRYSDDNGATWTDGGASTFYLTTGNTVSNFRPTITSTAAGIIDVYFQGKDSAVSTGYNIVRIQYSGSAWGSVSTVSSDKSNGSGDPDYPKSIYDPTFSQKFLKAPVIWYSPQQNILQFFSEIPTAPAVSVNIGGVWKAADTVYVNVGGVWKTVDSMAGNVGGAWKQA